MHEMIPFVSYPYEWSYSMLADAALTQLKVQRALLRHGLSLKDATAFNIQFKGSWPVFIDVGSIEVPDRLDVWVAYSQFCRMFLFPLLLLKHRSVDFRQNFLSCIEGLSVERVVNIIGFFRALRPEMFLDLFLQYLLGARGKSQARALRTELQVKGGNPAVQDMNLQRLARKMDVLRKDYRLSGSWINYAEDNSYADKSRLFKEEFVREFIRRHKPVTVLDLGCNTGTFSVLAAREGVRVIAADSDHDCVDALYRRARQEKLNILPLLIDLSNPTPAMGFMNKERGSFLDRASCDAVLALALVHHLLVTSRLPLPAIVDLMASLARQHLVIEYVERQDDMFQTLLALRKDIYEDLTLEAFLSVFSRKFKLLRQVAIPDTHRHLCLFQRLQ